MLNRKAQLEDNLEYVLCIIGLIIGVVALTMIKADYNFSVDNARSSLNAQTTIQVYETKFLGTDLLNLVKAPANESLTYGEFFATLPKQYTEDVSQEEYNLWFSKINLCSTDVYTNMDKIFEPIYGGSWRITVTLDENILYDCYGTDIALFDTISTNMTLPSLDPEKELLVILEVSA